MQKSDERCHKMYLKARAKHRPYPVKAKDTTGQSEKRKRVERQLDRARALLKAMEEYYGSSDG